MSTFGDWEPDDSYALGEPDPRYVAERIHELRQFLSASAGETVTGWDALDPEEREVAVALGVQLTAHLLAQGRDGSALALHEARRYLSAQPEWKDLGEEERAVALALGDDIVRWLQLEGVEIK